eukprot:3339031-Alexandrium_andersonii.AAC.1
MLCSLELPLRGDLGTLVPTPPDGESAVRAEALSARCVGGRRPLKRKCVCALAQNTMYERWHVPVSYTHLRAHETSAHL